MARIADILSKTRKQYFTGREKEIADFRHLLNETELTCNILFLYGPAGQGKTTLTKEFVEMCRLNGNPHLYLHGRELVPGTAGFYEALINALHVSSFEEAIETFERSDKTFILFIDNYDKIYQLDDWFRHEFLPQLPSNVLTVFSGRNQPSSKWTTDAGWQKLIRVMQLRNFSPGESRGYLEKRGTPPEQHNKILNFTHGHPLALSLVADLLEQHPDKNFSPEESPDVVQTLLDHFLLKAPSPAHKTALEICAMTDVTSESLLASVMDLEDAGELFEWLKNLSFIESHQEGLFPHDLTREALVADLKWRNPDWFKHLHHKTKNYYIGKLEKSNGEEQRRFLFKLNYLLRNHPMVRPYFNWSESSGNWVDIMRKTDIAPLAEMIEKTEAADAAKAFTFWANHPAAQGWVWRGMDLSDAQKGFVLRININEIDEREKVKDEVMKKVIDYIKKNFHLRKGEVCTVFRFWMAGDTYQKVSDIQSSIFLYIMQYYLTTQNLAVHLLSISDAGFWSTVLNYSGLERVRELDYSSSENSHGFFMHDWRKTPPRVWLSLLGERENNTAEEPAIASPKTKTIVLSEAEFSDSVYSSLKDYHSEKKLSENPLLFSKLVLDGNQENGAELLRVEILKEKIDRAIKKIEQSPRDEKYHRILYRTFINPVGSQEQTAAFMQLPFSTYRRHLKIALNLVTEILWAQEISS